MLQTNTNNITISNNIILGRVQKWGNMPQNGKLKKEIMINQLSINGDDEKPAAQQAEMDPRNWSCEKCKEIDKI
jgi:hypothetical protein